MLQAKEMLSLIGYPDWIANDTALDEYYELVNLERKILRIKKILKIHFSKFRKNLYIVKNEEKYFLFYLTPKNYFYEKS